MVPRKNNGRISFGTTYNSSKISLNMVELKVFSRNKRENLRKHNATADQPKSMLHLEIRS
ncbi:hypothetical protein IGI04_014678 [Brassica rapa subsp. trilocularis]|uniref:Legume lectin domain-containing protein n=1 Tax=Brassica rapa subsp. trilocularis TaxID=1813537 RepID=A0ABQ7MQY9_BRACM|nr:hypothetical protein IGI04_014678 [Brassica rapa subsp. trilocularis]